MREQAEAADISAGRLRLACSWSGCSPRPWGPTWTGKAEWALPYDLWGTLIATARLVHGNIGGLYAPPTGLVSLPGAAVILLPCAAVIAALGLSLADPRPAQPAPAGLAAGRAVPDRAVLRDAVRRRRPRRAARRDQAGSAACSPSRARAPVDGVRPLGAPGGRRSGRAAALRGPRAGPVADRAGRLARRRRGLRPAAGAARAADAARAPAVAANGGVPRPVGPAVRGAARRGGAGQLARHVHLGDQPARTPR